MDPLKAPLAELVAAVRRRREQAVGPLPGPRYQGCAVCANWRLREGEARHKDGHVTGCALRGVTIHQTTAPAAPSETSTVGDHAQTSAELR